MRVIVLLAAHLRRVRASTHASYVGMAALAALAAIGAPAPLDAGDQTLRHEGRPYLRLTDVTRRNGGACECGVDAPHARLRLPGQSLQVTRNSARMLVDGRPALLEAPVRVVRGEWWAPEGLTRLVAVRPMRAPTNTNGDASRAVSSSRTEPPPHPRSAPTIVLDAGHGGHDTGAIGWQGLTEKDVALDVTRRLARLLEGELRVTVRLTRDRDEYLSLRERTTFANRQGADLFVSLHANATRQGVSEGVEVYFLSPEASDGVARQAAAAENSVVRFEPRANAQRSPLDAVLWDLAHADFQRESSRLAELVLDSMTRTLRIPSRGVKQAGFYVLGGAAMPAILIETGFVTSPVEAGHLRDPRYRERLAHAVFDGISAYWHQGRRRLDGAAGVAHTGRD